MATQVKFRGGTTTEHSSFVGSDREMTVDTTKETLVVHDGSTAGGFPLARASSSESFTCGALTATTLAGNGSAITNLPVDPDNYADGLSWNTSTGVLTLTRTGSLADITVDLDGKYSESAHTHSGVYAPNSHTHVVADITDITATAAELNYTTNVTSDIQSQIDSKTTSTYVDTEISNLIDSAPGTLDTLNELAAALGDDPNHVTTMTNLINGLIPSGSVMMFFQAAAPTGWTQSTGHNDKALRVVSGTGGGSGGSTAFTTAFTHGHAHTISGGAHTLTIAEMPSHTHVAQAFSANYGGTVPASSPGNQGTQSGVSAATGGGGSHTHPAAGSVTSSTISPHYVDVIICSRN
jgi:hypothetical protein